MLTRLILLGVSAVAIAIVKMEVPVNVQETPRVIAYWEEHAMLAMWDQMCVVEGVAWILVKGHLSPG